MFSIIPLYDKLYPIYLSVLSTTMVGFAHHKPWWKHIHLWWRSPRNGKRFLDWTSQARHKVGRLIPKTLLVGGDWNMNYSGLWWFIVVQWWMNSGFVVIHSDVGGFPGTWLDYDFPWLLGMSSSQLTNSYFSEGWYTTNQIDYDGDHCFFFGRDHNFVGDWLSVWICWNWVIESYWIMSTNNFNWLNLIGWILLFWLKRPMLFFTHSSRS